MRGKSKYILALTGGLAAAGGLYVWHRLRQFAPTQPKDAEDAARIMLRGGQKVLAYSAHPDDLELFAGGTLRRLHLLGNDITVVDCSNGELSRPRQNLGRRRRHEQRRAGSILGYNEIKYLGLPDRALDSADLKMQVRRLVDQEKPDLVLTFDHVHLHPWLYHRDHFAIGAAVVDAIHEQHANALIFLYASAKPNVLVDIGSVSRQKICALASHASQFPAFRKQGAAALTRLLANATALGSNLRRAEAFRSLHSVSPCAKMPGKDPQQPRIAPPV